MQEYSSYKHSAEHDIRRPTSPSTVSEVQAMLQSTLWFRRPKSYNKQEADRI